MSNRTADDVLLSIQELLDGVEWTPQTLNDIAEILRENGYSVRDEHECD